MTTYRDRRPLILVHGLWNTPKLFNGLVDRLSQFDVSTLTPNLPHRYGRISLLTLAEEFDGYIKDHLDPQVPIDLLGFSMGGIVGRIWLQWLGGSNRVNRFISVGSPHFGTLTAQIAPSSLLRGIAEMKRNSPLLKELNRDISLLQTIECCSYFCNLDLMVFPGWQAALPLGPRYSVPVLTHKQLISHPVSLEILTKAILYE